MQTHTNSVPPAVNENKVVALVAAVQFVNIVEFMMVMPLGPDFASSLNIPENHLGYIGGSYTAAAAIAGLVTSTFLDRFDRRKALACIIGGLVLATLVCAMAQDFHSLLIGRVLAGCFGGPATALALSIIADVVPPHRRGRAMGTVMMAFSLASIAGVPFGLELAQLGNWRTPFFAVAGLCVLVAGMAIHSLPALTMHMQNQKKDEDIWTVMLDLLARPVVIMALAMTAFMMMSVFSLIPNFAAYVQYNLGFPREQMGVLYFCGGVASFVIMRPVGVLTDRYGSAIVGTVGSVLLCSTIFALFVKPATFLPIVLLFSLFMACSSIRGIPLNALTSKIPAPHERARYMSLQSAVQHLSAAFGAFYSSVILTVTPDHQLVGMNTLGVIAIFLAMMVPVLLYLLQARIPEAHPVPIIPIES